MTGHRAVGKHLFADLAGCDAASLNDVGALADLLRHACADAGATVLDVVARTFDPQGVTIIAVLAESHASIHTYPEHGVAFVDAFTCGDQASPGAIIATVVAALGATRRVVTVRTRDAFGGRCEPTPVLTCPYRAMDGSDCIREPGHPGPCYS